jgi:elongation factor Ts
MEDVKVLRERTGAGVLDCKKALEQAAGSMEKAVVLLREQGVAAAAKRAGKATAQGVVSSYIHAGGRIGVLVELNCETDFVARTEEFQQLAKELAMHVAAEDPQFLSREEVPAEMLDKEKEIYRIQAQKAGKPEKVLDKIVEGKLNNFYRQVCLLEQAYVRDDSKSVGDLLKETMGRLGENIMVRRFMRFQLGEDTAE